MVWAKMTFFIYITLFSYNAVMENILYKCKDISVKDGAEDLRNTHSMKNAI